MTHLLAETDLLKIKKVSEKDNFGVFVFEPLSPGYGTTLGNGLRRILLSSLEGAAITSIKVEGAQHEFSTISGVKEDLVNIMLNLKSLKLRSHSEEPIQLKLSKTGPGKVMAADFEKNPQIEIIDPNHLIATLDKNKKLELQATVDKGRGYIAADSRGEERLPLGTIALDAIYSPIEKVNFQVENTRVGGRTDFDKLTLEITTDSTISPSKALWQAAQILVDHFQVVTFELKVENVKPEKDIKKVKKAPKKAKKSPKTKKIKKKK